MDGAQHYRTAEACLREALQFAERAGDQPAPLDAISTKLAEAQVHATLALAAATALPAVREWTGSMGDAKAWSTATEPTRSDPS